MSDSRSRTRDVIDSRVTAERDDPIVVFHVGMRINALWKLHRWLPILLVAPRMVRELLADPDSGLLGSRTVLGPGVRNVGFVQYWDSFEDLREYARDGDRLHRETWQEFYRDGTDGAVGIWHETYLVDPDEYEAVYNDMPPHGLGACDGTEIVSATDQRETASGRLGRTDGADVAVGAEGSR